MSEAARSVSRASPPTSPTLQRLIAKTIAQLRHRMTDGDGDAVLCLGQRHQAFPTSVVIDPVLEPVDKIIWMVIWQQGAAAGSAAAFPKISEIAHQANVGSDSTVSRALAILRATRWLSLCARVRGTNGRFRGNVYALHDEPLPLLETLTLDADYMTFLERAARHHHARVRAVAAGVLASLDTDIRAGVDVTEVVPVIERRLAAEAALADESGGRYFAFTSEVLRSLSNADVNEPATHQHQNLVSVDDHNQNLVPQNSVMGSSCSNNIKTTTTDQSLLDEPRAASEIASELIYPSALTLNERNLAARYLAQLPHAQRQPVLDELEGRLRAARQGAKPVHNELRYLQHLCKLALAGAFEPTLGLKVEAARERQHAFKAAGTAPTNNPPATEVSTSRIRASGENPVAAIRKKFNLRSSLPVA